jgi:hypothetical protein
MYTAISVSSAPVATPTSAPNNNNNNSKNNGRVSAPPLPTPLPPQSLCPAYFCSEYYWTCRDTACLLDREYQECRRACLEPDLSCEMTCSEANLCFRQCKSNLVVCLDHCSGSPSPS